MVDAHWPRNVLELPLAGILEGNVDLLLRVFQHPARYADAAGTCNPFQPGCHVYAIPIDVPTVDDDVTHVDADPELDPLFLRDLRIAADHATLDLNRTA